MSRLLLITALFTFALAAYADQLTIYQIESPRNGDEPLSMTLEGSSIADLMTKLPPGAQIKSQAQLQSPDNEHYYLNDTYSLRFVEEYSADGKPIKWSSRQVGMLINAHLSRDNQLTFYFQNTDLETWATYMQPYNLPQPIFSTTAINTEFNLPTNRTIAFGNLSNEKFNRYTVIERISGENPQPSPIIVQQSTRHDRYQINVYEMAFDGPSRNPDTGDIIPRDADLVREQGKLIDFYELQTDNGVNYYFDNTRSVLGGGKDASGEPVLMESTIGARILLFAEDDFVSVHFSRRTLDRWMQLDGVDTPIPIIEGQSFQSSVSLKPGQRVDEVSIGGIEGTDSHDGVASPYVSRIYYLKRIKGEPTDTSANPFGD